MTDAQIELSDVAASAPRGQYARSEGTRLRILDAALAEANETGFQRTSVARIAARANVAVGNLNYHFGSKGALLRELMTRLVADLWSRLAPAQGTEDFFAFEEACLVAYLDFLVANPSYVRLAEEVRHLDPELYREGVNVHISQIIDRLQRGIRRGELRPLDADEIRAQAYVMLGTYTFLDRYIEDAVNVDPHDVARSLVRSLRGGLAAPLTDSATAF